MTTPRTIRTLLLLGFGVTLAPACGGGGGGKGHSPTTAVVAQQTVDSAGGTVGVTDPSSELVGTQVDIPPGALSAPTDITISRVVSGGPYPADVLDFEFGPSGTVFTVPVTVTIKYLEQYLTDNGLADPTLLRVVDRTPGAAPDALATESQDTVAHTISVKTTHFTSFAVLGYTNAVLSGSYGMVTYKYDDAGIRPLEPTTGNPSPYRGGYSVSMQTVTFDGAGFLTAGAAVQNTDGAAPPPGGGGGTYSVAPDGTFTASVGSTLQGSVMAGGSVVVFGSTSGVPVIGIALKKGSGLGNAVLSGTYGVVSYKHDDAGVRPVEPGPGSISPYEGGYTVDVQTVTFDGFGGLSAGASIQNTDGAAPAPSGGSGTYTVGFDGTVTGSVGSSIRGYVLAGGGVFVLGSTTGVPSISIAVRKGSGLTNATASGTYGMVSYKFDDAGVRPLEPGPGGISPYEGGYSVSMQSLTADGAGNLTAGPAVQNTDGAAPASLGGIGSYSVSSIGTLTGSAGSSLLGSVLPSGSVIVFGAMTGVPVILIAVRR
jgi:hypothetical protein